MHPTDLLSKSVPLSLSPMAQQKRLRDSLRRERWAKYVTDEALDEMLEQATVRSYPRKSFVLRHRDRGHNFFGLLSGQVRLSIPASSGDRCSPFSEKLGVIKLPKHYFETRLADHRPSVSKQDQVFLGCYVALQRQSLFCWERLFTALLCTHRQGQ